MGSALGLVITALLTIYGSCKVIWPGILLDREEASADGAPTPQQLSESRIQGIVLLAFGIIGLYAILTWDGTPPEFIGV
ncbi:MAG TPA: hypothetical protein VFB96_00050 [Pirellulaceae bacterium]|jgi:hypothetical protein|nr:hypothetical protein [Pirellulaceae bacterium]